MRDPNAINPETPDSPGPGRARLSLSLPVLVSSNKAQELKSQLAQNPPPDPQSAPRPSLIDRALDPTKTPRQKLIEERVIEMVRTIYDPEIPINIYDLGLIYDIAVHPTDDTVVVKMTLTAPACPVAGTLPPEVERKIETIPQVKSATVELVWEPAWSKDKMSEAALLDLGLL